MTFLTLRCPRLHGVEWHHKGLNSQISDMFKTHEHTYSGGKSFKYKFGWPECVKGHPKWKVIPTSLIPPFQESKLSGWFHFYRIYYWIVSGAQNSHLWHLNPFGFLIFDHFKHFLHLYRTWRTPHMWQPLYAVSSHPPQDKHYTHSQVWNGKQGQLSG